MRAGFGIVNRHPDGGGVDDLTLGLGFVTDGARRRRLIPLHLNDLVWWFEVAAPEDPRGLGAGSGVPGAGTDQDPVSALPVGEVQHIQTLAAVGHQRSVQLGKSTVAVTYNRPALASTAAPQGHA